MPLLILVISLLLTIPAAAQDLGMAGALSGMGQGMGRGLEQMQSAIIQQGLMQERYENERKLREQQYQYELEMRRLQHQQQRPQQDTDAVNRHIQDSIRQGAQQLTSEAYDLNKEKDAIDAQAARLVNLRTADPARYQTEIVAHNQRAEDHRLHHVNYMERYDAYHKRYGLTPPPGYQREAEMRQLALQKHQRALAEAERHIQESSKAERVTLDLIRGPSTEEILNSLRPGWRTIIGATGSDVPYRQWLKQQPKAYQRRINDSAGPEEINESIGEFLESNTLQASGR